MAFCGIFPPQNYPLIHVCLVLSSLRQPLAGTCKIPASPYSTQVTTLNINNNNNNLHHHSSVGIPNGNVTNIPSAAAPPGGQKQSMLEKLKLFNSKEKVDKTSKSTISKRTSSSSGFSSARSERSDSSLSLNDNQVITVDRKVLVNGGGKKVVESKVSSSSKSSKLISSKGKGESKVVGGKGLGGGAKGKEPETHIPKQKIPTTAMTTSATSKIESKLKPGSVGRTGKLDAKSESKTSLVQPQPVKPMAVAPPSSVSTGIPKPMAAVKGTSKPVQQPILVDGPSAKTREEMAKLDRALAGLQNGLGSPTPNGNNLLGSPLHHKAPPGPPSSMSDSMHSNSTQGASMGQHSNSSESSSVVYRPSGSESGSNSPQKSSSPRSNATGSFLFNDVNLNTANNNKFNTVPSKILNTNPTSAPPLPNGTIYENHAVDSTADKSLTTVMPMRPLLRGYNSHVTLPTRGARGHHHFISEYCDGPNGTGYCSDGDALRKIPARYSDSMDNGYLSEGSGGPSMHLVGKQFIGSSLRNHRTPLPTTIEER